MDKLSRLTLRLNGGLPFQISSWQDAIYCLFEENKATVMEEYEDFPLRHAGGKIYMLCPAVINLNKFVHGGKLRYSRKHVFERDNNTCQYCNQPLQRRENRELDHIIPKSSPSCPHNNVNATDDDKFGNIVTVCPICNRQKANKSLEQMRNEVCWNNRPFKLLKHPETPLNLSYIRFVSEVREYNLIWLQYIPNWIYYASRCNKLKLIKLYREKYGEDDFLKMSIEDAIAKKVNIDEYK